MTCHYPDDLFPHSRPGVAQTPFLYNKAHNDLLNKITAEGKRCVDTKGRVFYVLEKSNVR